VILQGNAVRLIVLVLGGLLVAGCTAPHEMQPASITSPSALGPPSSSSITPTTERHGVLLRRSKKWSDPGTVTLWNVDRLFVAVVHGSGGYYALDLSHVAECPVNIREGEGWYVDHPSMEIVFDCADSSVWARFDPYGKRVPGTPPRKERPAFKVVAQEDGSLLVVRKPPSRPLTTYWSSV
jgi:hypothetical protein